MLLNKTITRKILETLVHETFSQFGISQCSSLLDSLKLLGFFYATNAGISINLEDLKTPNSKSKCIENANKYGNLADWKKYDLPYFNRANNKGWYYECNAHFTNLRGVSRTFEECIEDAKKYKTHKEWKKNSSTIYGYAVYKKWLQEIKSLVFNQ